MVGKSDINTGTVAMLEETAFHLALSKLKIAHLNYQKLAIRKTVVEKDDIFIYLPTATGKSFGHLFNKGSTVRKLARNEC